MKAPYYNDRCSVTCLVWILGVDIYLELPGRVSKWPGRIPKLIWSGGPHGSDAFETYFHRMRKGWYYRLDHQRPRVFLRPVPDIAWRSSPYDRSQPLCNVDSLCSNHFMWPYMANYIPGDITPSLMVLLQLATLALENLIGEGDENLMMRKPIPFGREKNRVYF